MLHDSTLQGIALHHRAITVVTSMTQFSSLPKGGDPTRGVTKDKSNASLLFFQKHREMVSVVFALIGSLVALNPSKYPASGVKAPANPKWTEKFLKGVTIPNVPVNPSGAGEFPVTDRTRCIQDLDWSLTFDDGPSPHTKNVLDALSAKGIKATFFVVGSQVLLYPDVLKRIHEEGHQIALHTWSHPYLPSLTNDEIVAEMVYTSQVIRDVIGVSPKHVRVPFGSIDRRVRAVLQAMGLEIIYWTRDTDDWKLNFTPIDNWTPKTVYDLFRTWASEAPQGSISLQHDIQEVPTTLVPEVLTILGNKFNFKTLNACVNVPAHDDFIHNLVKADFETPVTTTTAVVPTTTVPPTTKPASSTSIIVTSSTQSETSVVTTKTETPNTSTSSSVTKTETPNTATSSSVTKTTVSKTIVETSTSAAATETTTDVIITTTKGGVSTVIPPSTSTGEATPVYPDVSSTDKPVKPTNVYPDVTATPIKPAPSGVYGDAPAPTEGTKEPKYETEAPKGTEKPVKAPKYDEDPKAEAKTPVYGAKLGEDDVEPAPAKDDETYNIVSSATTYSAVGLLSVLMLL
jgi:peptidoglycan/xylan/chitin deacetylase (PgdA/CDA1 family)